MKTLYAAFLSISSVVSGFSQSSNIKLDPLPVADGKVKYEAVVSVENSSEKNLFSNSKQWIAESFKDSKSVVDMEDAGAKVVMGKGNFITTFKSPFKGSPFQKTVEISQRISFSFRISSKEGRYKYEFFDFNNLDGYRIDLAERYQFQRGPIELSSERFNGRNEEQKKKQIDDVQSFSTPFFEAIDQKVRAIVVSLNTSMKKSDW